MARTHARSKKSLEERFPPSPPCSCPVCAGYCARPGWWTVQQAARAIQAGYAPFMMLEMAPEGDFAVLSPAFNGCEGGFALEAFKWRGCTFHQDNLCRLHGTGHQPLECRFCHHDRPGLGLACHAALEQDWHTAAGQELAARWSKITGLWEQFKAVRRLAQPKRGV